MLFMIHYALIIANHRPECNVFLWLFYLAINFNNENVFLFFRPGLACFGQQKKPAKSGPARLSGT
jgi:hypothetical protein